WDASFVLSIGLMSMLKESFMVIVPALLVLKIWLSRERLPVSWTQSLKRNGPAVLALTLLLVAQSFLIVFVTGTIAGGYVGYDGFYLGKILKAAEDLFLAGHIECFGFLLVLALFSLGKIFEEKRSWRAVLVPLGVFFFLLTASQVVLFQKTGIAGHYVLPGVFAFWLALIWLYRLVEDKFGAVRRLILLAVVVWVVYIQTVLAYGSGISFKKEGATVAALTQALKERTGPQDTILMVLDPGRHLEWSYAFKRYIEEFSGRPNLYLLPILRPNYTTREKYLAYVSPMSPLNFYRRRMITDVPDVRRIKGIVVFPTSQIWLYVLARGWFDKYQFDREQIGDFALYIRKSPPSPARA
ncbi:MAG: hypothetical protein WCG06_01080, partial [Candidatus Omnitrophota bacterium]